MVNHKLQLMVSAENTASAGMLAQSLGDMLREIQGVEDVNRRKTDHASMDLGTVVTAIATSAATLAIARGIAAWLQARRGASITIERDANTGSIKAAVAGIDSDAAVRIAEIVRG